MYTVETCKQELIKCLEKILSRDEDIDKSKYDDLELELMEVRFGCSFIIYVNQKKFNVNFFTPIETAKYIYDNVNDVTYIKCNSQFFDTLVGDIHDFIVNNFDFEEYNPEYFKAMQLYEHFIKESEITLTLENIVSYIKERL